MKIDRVAIEALQQAEKVLVPALSVLYGGPPMMVPWQVEVAMSYQNAVATTCIGPEVKPYLAEIAAFRLEKAQQHNPRPVVLVPEHLRDQYPDQYVGSHITHGVVVAVASTCPEHDRLTSALFSTTAYYYVEMEIQAIVAKARQSVRAG